MYTKKAVNVWTLTACCFFLAKSGFLRYVGKQSGSGKVPVPPAKVDGVIGEGAVHDFCFSTKCPWDTTNFSYSILFGPVVKGGVVHRQGRGCSMV